MPGQFVCNEARHGAITELRDRHSVFLLVRFAINVSVLFLKCEILALILKGKIQVKGVQKHNTKAYINTLTLREIFRLSVFKNTIPRLIYILLR